MGDNDLSDTYDFITWRLLKGKVVPVLGAGANLCERPAEAGFEKGRYLPSGRELAEELNRIVRLPPTEAADLARVAQYLAARVGEGPLIEELHDVFDSHYPPTRLHRFLAAISRRTRRGGQPGMILVTTNYDDALEQAFFDAGEEYDVLTYIADGPDRGRFLHVPHGADPVVIIDPNVYYDLNLDRRALIVKIHGAVRRDRTGEGEEPTAAKYVESFVITEDHYIDYLTRSDVGRLLPALVQQRLVVSHFLFLGYGLRDWNVRAILHRLWTDQAGRTFSSWAVDRSPDAVDRWSWDHRGVEILPVSLEEFVAQIEARIGDEEGRSG
jgi:hypothetical protein